MKCPKCACKTRIVDVRERKGYVRRRHHCACGHRFSTLEAVVNVRFGPSSYDARQPTKRLEEALGMIR